MEQMTKEDWKNIFELLDMGADFDNDGCDYSAREEKSEQDIKLMTSYRKLKEAVGA